MTQQKALNHTTLQIMYQIQTISVLQTNFEKQLIQIDLQMITLQLNQLCFTKNSIKFAKSPGEVSSAAPGRLFVVGSNSSLWSRTAAKSNKLEPILCIEEPMSSLPDSTVSCSTLLDVLGRTVTFTSQLRFASMSTPVGRPGTRSPALELGFVSMGTKSRRRFAFM